jgi:hypothetical protein
METLGSNDSAVKIGASAKRPPTPSSPAGFPARSFDRIEKPLIP